MVNKKIILFDFDGVLVDSFHISFSTANETIYGKEMSENEYKKIFEGNVYKDALKNIGRIPSMNHFFDTYAPKIFQYGRRRRDSRNITQTIK